MLIAHRYILKFFTSIDVLVMHLKLNTQFSFLARSSYVLHFRKRIIRPGFFIII